MSWIMQEAKLDYQLVPSGLKLCKIHTEAAEIKFTHAVSVLVSPDIRVHSFPTVVILLWMCNNLGKEGLVMTITV